MLTAALLSTRRVRFVCQLSTQPLWGSDDLYAAEVFESTVLELFVWAPNLGRQVFRSTSRCGAKGPFSPI